MQPTMHVTPETNNEGEGSDRSALLRMMAYVEAECRRLGADGAARHVAVAAGLIPAFATPNAVQAGVALH